MRYIGLPTIRCIRCFSAAVESKASCFACAILSHGTEGVMYGVDGRHVRTEHLIQKVSSVRGLVGKPKIFFIQVLVLVTTEATIIMRARSRVNLVVCSRFAFCGLRFAFFRLVEVGQWIEGFDLEGVMLVTLCRQLLIF